MGEDILPKRGWLLVQKTKFVKRRIAAPAKDTDGSLRMMNSRAFLRFV